MMAWCLACVHSRHGEDLLVNLLEGIDALLEIDVVRGKLGLYLVMSMYAGHTTITVGAYLVIGLAQLLLGELEGA